MTSNTNTVTSSNTSEVDTQNYHFSIIRKKYRKFWMPQNKTLPFTKVKYNTKCNIVWSSLGVQHLQIHLIH